MIGLLLWHWRLRPTLTVVRNHDRIAVMALEVKTDINGGEESLQDCCYGTGG